MPRDRLPQRLVRCVIGLLMCGTGIATIIHAELGLAPWDVFHQGVSDQTGIPIGTVIVFVGVALLVLWIPLRVRPGLGTFLNAVIIGVAVDVADPLLPTTDGIGWRILLLTTGLVLFGAGSGLYIGAGLGPGPRDGLMTGLAAHGLSIRLARTVVEIAALVVGVLLGGSIGVGTAAFALGIGPLVHVFLPRFTMDADQRLAPVH